MEAIKVVISTPSVTPAKPSFAFEMTEEVLRLRNVRFLRGGRVLEHNNPWLEYAESVSITFEWQTKDVRMDTVTQMASAQYVSGHQ